MTSIFVSVVLFEFFSKKAKRSCSLYAGIDHYSNVWFADGFVLTGFFMGQWQVGQLMGQI